MGWAEWLILCFQILIIVIVRYYLKYYYPSYFAEKAKNLATKEDISQITHIVESVKSDVDLMNKKRTNALSELFASLIKLVEGLTRLKDFCSHLKNIEIVTHSPEMEKRAAEIDEYVTRIRTLYYKITILCNDDTFLEAVDAHIHNHLLIADKSKMFIFGMVSLNIEREKFKDAVDDSEKSKVAQSWNEHSITYHNAMEQLNKEIKRSKIEFNREMKRILEINQ